MSETTSSVCRYVLAMLIVFGVGVCLASPGARADGISFGVGVGVGSGYGPPPPAAYPPPQPAYVPQPEEESVAPPPVMVQQAAPPVVVERPAPVAVYTAPVVVEKRSRVYYYYPAYRSYYSHSVETHTDYYGGSRYREDDYEY